MEWKDDAVVLGVRKHGETSVIAELMTRNRGRHLGLVQGGRSRTQRPILQPGNSVQAVWRARLDEHLGTFQLEGKTLRAARLMERPHAIYALQTLACHLRLLPERDSHPALFEMVTIVLENLEAPEIAGELVVRFELAVLDELGFGLDLASCAATGTQEHLNYVSPKSGRAVSEAAAEPYLDTVLPLPSFLRPQDAAQLPRETAHASLQDVEQGFALAGYFFQRHVYGPRGIAAPTERESLLRAIVKMLKTEPN